MKQWLHEFHSEENRNYEVEILSLCSNIINQILYTNTPFFEMSHTHCKICIT